MYILAVKIPCKLTSAVFLDRRSGVTILLIVIERNLHSNKMGKESQDTKKVAIHWFRKGLRLHDNPALVAAVQGSQVLRPVFVLDPNIAKEMRVGPNRWRFLIQSLTDLDQSLQKLNSKLFILRGHPKDVFRHVFKEWKVGLLTYEHDTEPYSKIRDAEVDAIAMEMGVRVRKEVSNTIFDTARIISTCGGKPPLTYQGFLSTISKLGKPPKPVENPSFKSVTTPVNKSHEKEFGIPSLEDLGVDSTQLGPIKFPGGETEALKRLDEKLKNHTWVCKFEKPNTSSNSIEPSTTVLSPYVKFGCLSARLFYWKLQEIYEASKNGHSKPPVSLHGQLLWREFFYTVGSVTPNFDRMEGNPICRQIPWQKNPTFLEAWAHAKTGYPLIDAIMTQLREEGWIHHLARHAVACFLTRGDLWISWVEGMKVFEELLLDADWSLNAANWMWLSASAFFHQYFRVYSPIAFGKKTDPNGDYIRKYIPVLKKLPAKYIYEPWNAPPTMLKAAGCELGKDYPRPIVIHENARKVNLKRMGEVYGKKAEYEKNESPPTKKARLSPQKCDKKKISNFFKKK